MASVEREDPVLVCVRVRPQSPEELDRRCCVRVAETADGVGAVVLEGAQQRAFAFDVVAGPDATQEELFDAVGKPATEACFAGYNACVFAYGQTASGSAQPAFISCCCLTSPTPT